MLSLETQEPERSGVVGTSGGVDVGPDTGAGVAGGTAGDVGPDAGAGVAGGWTTVLQLSKQFISAARRFT